MFTMSNSTDNAKVNSVVINGFKVGYVTDEVAEILAMMVKDSSTVNNLTTKAANVASVEKASKKSNKVQMVGKVGYSEDFLTVTDNNGEYRLYITCPLGGEKGKKVRYAIKCSAKEYGATFAGNYDKGEIFWVFPNKTKANAFCKARKEYAKKASK